MMRISTIGRLAVGALLSALSFAGIARADGDACRTINLSDPGWTDITSTNGVTGVLLGALGYEPDIKTLSVPIGYQSMKTGETDVFLGNWMPAQKAFVDDLNKAKAIEVLNRNLQGAKFTLAVPTYVADKGVKNFADLQKHADEFDHKIYGIEPGAPANSNIQKMIDANDFGLKGWELVESSEQAMLSQVERAGKDKQAIVFLAWAPHPMNERFQIAYLAGGDAYFGPDYGGAQVYTLARTGWAAACPNAAKLFHNLTFDIGMENSLMGSILGGEDAKTAATAWLKAHPEAMTPWLAGVTTIDGKPGLDAVKVAVGL
ncbi:choline ABC transporter substrate-binding protein [Rhizobium sp. CNPSo 3464]|uniref:choline ABC transporter substrate-binding protein n=1 Tax=Rhizobium sp. CNPSo 3464 TaxID=3021406 RepID=UPI00254FEEE8|nr:choline ABC transporter substrate-binding protein [Rhizobium sp. CNPSo 3464]MDK4740803.1 choline ABC transporter substrate-binding protein [Rhizobium sp. CNPSo 3464]